MELKNLYKECNTIERTKPDVTVTEAINRQFSRVLIFSVCPINLEIAKEIGRNYRTLPAFEKGLFEYVYMKHYSIERNQLLRCRWLEYKKHIEERIFAPFQFPCTRDLHFYSGCIRFMPSETIIRFPSHRMKLKPGPGVDFRGQMPIPQELMMKRGRIKKEVVATAKENKINQTQTK